MGSAAVLSRALGPQLAAQALGWRRTVPGNVRQTLWCRMQVQILTLTLSGTLRGLLGVDRTNSHAPCLLHQGQRAGGALCPTTRVKRCGYACRCAARACVHMTCPNSGQWGWLSDGLFASTAV